MTLKELIDQMATQLADAGVGITKVLDARLITQHVLEIGPEQVLRGLEKEIPQEKIIEIEKLIARRINREPVSRIIGKREFWSLDFALTPATLDPRPDSETLVETVLKNIPDRNANLRILDLGTGTGCLLLALLSELPNATGVGVDISDEAVQTAQKNAIQLELDSRVAFKVNNWADNITEQFDIVISNPPYITSADILTLEPEVAHYDPMAALDGGADGLDAYRVIASQLPSLLKPDGFFAFEIGQGQGPAVGALLAEKGLKISHSQADLAGIERCLLGLKA